MNSHGGTTRPAALWGALLLAALPPLAGQPLARTRWEYGDGFVQRSRSWQEENVRARYTFVETARNPVFVELYDAGRRYFVRLYDDKMLVKGGGGKGAKLLPKFTRARTGSWADGKARAEWKYAGGSVRLGGEAAWFEKNSQGISTFAERGRTDAHVELDDPLRGYAVRLSAAELNIRGGKEDGDLARFPRYTKLYAGRWAKARGPARAKVVVDVREPAWADWAARAKKLCETWYPIISERLSPNRPPEPREIRLLFKKDPKGIAFTNSGSPARITINTAWLEEHPDDFGMIIHELTHVVQDYRPKQPGANPGGGWVVEGMADYVRYSEFEPERPMTLNPKGSYRDGYATAALFLDWVERTHDRRLVEKLNVRLREGAYRDALFEELTGRALDRLWADFLADAAGQ
jgi:hypothetical protein